MQHLRPVLHREDGFLLFLPSRISVFLLVLFGDPCAYCGRVEQNPLAYFDAEGPWILASVALLVDRDDRRPKILGDILYVGHSVSWKHSQPSFLDSRTMLNMFGRLARGEYLLNHS